MLAISMAPSGPFISPISVPSSETPTLRHMTSKRPKLSLQTSDITPTYVGATSGRRSTNLDTAITPTGLNTFTNAFDLSYRPSPSSALPSPGSLSRRSTFSLSALYTLNLPYGIRPILKNSPLARDERRSSLASDSDSPRSSSRRTFFPAPKRVEFRSILEEEIVTKDYVARHVDLSSSDENEASSSESEDVSSRSTPETSDEEVEYRAVRVDEASPKGRRKRDSASLSSREEDRGREGVSRSTSRRRTKRQKRRWEWTISVGQKVAEEEKLDASSGTEARETDLKPHDQPGSGG